MIAETQPLDMYSKSKQNKLCIQIVDRETTGLLEE